MKAEPITLSQANDEKASDMGNMGFLSFSKSKSYSYQGLADSPSMSYASETLNFQRSFCFSNDFT